MDVERKMVGLADAIVNPWTMVIIPFNTSITDVAMTRSGQADYFTEWAETFWIKCFKQIYELY